MHRGKVASGEIHVDQAARLAVDPAHRARRPCATTRARTCCTRRCARCSGPSATQTRLARDARPPALRLQPRRAGRPRRARRDRGPRQRLDRDATRPRVRRGDGLPGRRSRPAPSRSSARSTAIACACLSFGDFSTELCGGTHARATGDIGVLKVDRRSRRRVGRAAHRGADRARGAAALARAGARARANGGAAARRRSASCEARVEKLLEERRALERELESRARGAAQRGVGRSGVAGRDDRRRVAAAREGRRRRRRRSARAWSTSCASA